MLHSFISTTHTYLGPSPFFPAAAVGISLASAKSIGSIQVDSFVSRFHQYQSMFERLHALSQPGRSMCRGLDGPLGLLSSSSTGHKRMTHQMQARRVDWSVPDLSLRRQSGLWLPKMSVRVSTLSSKKNRPRTTMRMSSSTQRLIRLSISAGGKPSPLHPHAQSSQMKRGQEDKQIAKKQIGEQKGERESKEAGSQTGSDLASCTAFSAASTSTVSSPPSVEEAL